MLPAITSAIIPTQSSSLCLFAREEHCIITYILAALEPNQSLFLFAVTLYSWTVQTIRVGLATMALDFPLGKGLGRGKGREG